MFACMVAEVADKLAKGKKVHYSSVAASGVSTDPQSSSSSLIRWYMLPEELGLHQCTICEESFHDARKLKMHITCQHPGTLLHKCASCDKNFTTASGLLRHMVCHVDPQASAAGDFMESYRSAAEGSNVSLEGPCAQYWCTICNKSLFTLNSLKQHQIQHAKDRAKHCPHCQMPFLYKHELDRHQSNCLLTSRMSRRMRKRQVCNVCGSIFRETSKFNYHMRLHARVEPHECAFCNKAFASPTQLVVHLTSHTAMGFDDQQEELSQLPVENLSIGPTVLSQEVLQDVYRCTICRELLFSADSLKRHQIQHANKIAVWCPHCQRPCSSQSRLKEHLCTHKEMSICITEKQTDHALPQQSPAVLPGDDHCCPRCGKQFSKRKYLQDHLRRTKSCQQLRAADIEKSCIGNADLATSDHLRHLDGTVVPAAQSEQICIYVDDDDDGDSSNCVTSSAYKNGNETAFNDPVFPLLSSSLLSSQHQATYLQSSMFGSSSVLPLSRDSPPHHQGELLETPALNSLYGCTFGVPTTPSVMSHNSCTILKCPHCSCPFKYWKTLEIHIREKHPNIDATSTYCASRGHHPQLGHGETYACGYKPYDCEVCNYSTAWNFNTRKHLQTVKHTNSDQKMSGCSTKQMTSIYCAGKGRHPQLTSGKSYTCSYKPYHCRVCNYSTALRSNLRIHQKTLKHVNNVQKMSRRATKQMSNRSVKCGYKPYRCEFCNYSTALRSNLRIHLKTLKHVNNVKKMSRRETKHMSDHSLKNRQSSVVLPGASHHCRQCGKRFASRKYLQDHLCRHERNLESHKEMSRHTTENESSAVLPEDDRCCPRCGKQFAKRRYLQDHMRRVKSCRQRQAADIDKPSDSDAYPATCR